MTCHLTRRPLAAVPGFTSLLFSAEAARAQYNGNSYNSYRNNYNRWNSSIPGYSSGPDEYRQQIHQMNPFGDAYREIQRQRPEHLWFRSLVS